MAQIKERGLLFQERQTLLDDDAEADEMPPELPREVGFVIPANDDMEDPEVPSSPFAGMRGSMRERSDVSELVW